MAIDGREEEGKSGITFRALVGYCQNARPRIVVTENVMGAPWGGYVKKTWEKAGYAVDWGFFDTKDYYLPQTRQRGYMICVDRRGFAKTKSDLRGFKETMAKLKRAASSPLEAFLLPDTDVRLQEAKMSHAEAIERDDPKAATKWVLCQGRYKNCRFAWQTGDGRPYSSWQNGGSCKVPDYAWHNWSKAQVERVWDTLDIIQLKYAGHGFDMQYKR